MFQPFTNSLSLSNSKSLAESLLDSLSYKSAGIGVHQLAKSYSDSVSDSTKKLMKKAKF